MRYLLIGMGGFLGANARYLVGLWIAQRFGTGFPLGTLVINVTGSLVIGFFMGLISDRFIVHTHWRFFFAIGFLGAYTTFSTFSYETFALFQDREYVLGLVNVFGSVTLGLLGVLGGMALARLL